VLVGAPIALLGFVFIPVAQSVLAIAVFILITNFGMALFRSPVVAWLGDLFEPNDRSKANGIINLMGGVGGLLAYFGGGILFNSFGRVAPFAAGAIAMTVALVVVLLRVKEPEKIATDKEVQERSVLENLKVVFDNPDKSGLFVLLGILFWFMAFNALETGLSSFAVFTLGMQAGTASIYTGLVTVTFILFRSTSRDVRHALRTRPGHTIRFDRPHRADPARLLPNPEHADLCHRACSDGDLLGDDQRE
jgi:maltose/moltooligosaccharide transporter